MSSWQSFRRLGCGALLDFVASHRHRCLSVVAAAESEEREMSKAKRNRVVGEFSDENMDIPVMFQSLHVGKEGTMGHVDDDV